MPDRRPAVVTVDRPTDHVASAAWRRLGLTGVAPTRIEVLKESWKTDAYRLAGCGPAGVDVIAARHATDATFVERTIYGEILPLSEVPRLRLHGVIDEADGTTWMFLDDAGEDMLDLRHHADRCLAGAWLGRLHRDLAGMSFADQLPDRGPADTLVTLRSAGESLGAVRRAGQLDDAGGRLIEDVIRRLDVVMAGWDRCADALADLPTTLVHADYVGKNLRRRRGPGEPDVLPFDWEMSGWGPPLRDLAFLDLGAYLGGARSVWGRRAADLDELADIGRLFGLVAAIAWEVPGLETGWLPRHLARTRVFHERLGSVLVRIGLEPSPARRNRGRAGVSVFDHLVRGLTTMEPRTAVNVVDVIDSEPNAFRSTFPSEIVRCLFDDGQERRLLVKRYVPGLHRGDRYWEGGPYEARIYDEILAAHDLDTPVHFGSWSDPRTGDTFLALEYVEGWRLSLSEPRWMIDAARWLGRLHRDATATAEGQPGIRRYDAPFFEGRSRDALASVRGKYPDATWIASLVRRFDTDMVPRLLGSEPVFIHGEPYPANVIISDGRIRTVDWQSAAIGPWPVDLACLTDGRWPAEVIEASVAAYAEERWPSGAPASFHDELDAARVYWSMRWLGADVDATTASKHPRYVERLRVSAERLGLVAAAG
jgi:aminoglycoside phosphotransferase (APT) family kinase protein